MDDEIVRCPYCILGNDFRLMLPRSGGWFVCLTCIQIAVSEKPEFKCFCQNCGELNRAA
jgi:DNA-directed RNA polymerase subunit RPC12/RpoP